MSVVIRCNKCQRFYAFKNKQCSGCGDDNKLSWRYYIRFNGKTIYAGDSLQIAKEMDMQMQKDKRLGNLEEYQAGKDISFGDFVSKYYEPHYNTRKSPQSIKPKVDYYMGIFKDRLMKSITPAEIEQAVNLKAIGLAPRTRDYYLAVIRRIFNYAIELELISKSPVKVKQLNVDNTRQSYLKDDEVERLLNACKLSKSEFLYPMVLIALYTGMRLGEIQKLKKIDLIDGIFYIKGDNTKNNRNKIIPLNAALNAYLEASLAEYDDFDFAHNCKRSNKICYLESQTIYFPSSFER